MPIAKASKDASLHPPEEATDDPWAERAEGSAWERLSMVNGEPARPSRWLLGAVGVVLMFVTVFAGVLAWLLHGTAPKTPRRLTDSLPRMEVNPAPQVENTPVLSTSPIPADKPETSPRVASDPADDAAPLPSVRDVRGPSTDLPPAPEATDKTGIETARAFPSPSPTPEGLIEVHLDSVPQGVEIRVHGNLLGLTPLNTRLPPGDHQLVTSFHNWPETRKVIHLDAGQTRVTVAIPLMRPELVPINAQPATPRNAKSPALGPFFERRARRATPVRVEPAQPVAPSPEAVTAPVRRPLPLEPFESGNDKPAHQEEVTPTPTASDEGDG